MSRLEAVQKAPNPLEAEAIPDASTKKAKIDPQADHRSCEDNQTKIGTAQNKMLEHTAQGTNKGQGPRAQIKAED